MTTQKNDNLINNSAGCGARTSELFFALHSNIHTMNYHSFDDNTKGGEKLFRSP